MQIIEQIRKGNSNAFSALVTKYQNVVYSIALKVLRNREEAEEMAQEAFIKAFRSVHTFQGKSKFSTWLFTITYNTCISHIRKNKFRTTGMDHFQAIDEEEEADFGEFQQEDRIKYLESALKQLSEDEYLLIVLYYYEDQSVEEISHVTGLSESNVKVKLFRARNRLHRIIVSLMNKEVLQP